MSEQVIERLNGILSNQKNAYFENAFPSCEERRQDLKQLAKFLRDYQEDIVKAISNDFGHRSRHETLMIEHFSTLKEIEHALKHIRTWIKPQKRHVDSMTFFGAQNSVRPQPLGVIGVVVPWNYPLFLAFGPVISALSAGNRAMVKMSTNSKNLATLLAEKMPAYVDENKLIFLPETGGVGRAFTQLAFDHMIFTGSSETGKSVMATAAQNLCGVTLELGGKSPAVVLDDFDLDKAVERIVFGKLVNAGQTCVGVDYVFVPRQKLDAFVEAAKKNTYKRFSTTTSKDYTSIIDQKAFERLTGMLKSAELEGAKLVQLLPGQAWLDNERKISPHLVIGVSEQHDLMQHEIFGPILPVIVYDQLEEVIQYINNRPRPLAFYPFSNDEKTIDMLIKRVISGGVSVNETVYHVGQADLPFGGVGNSGIGHYHGYDGFVTCSKMRPVFYQKASFSLPSLMQPPYGKRFDMIHKMLLAMTKTK